MKVIQIDGDGRIVGQYASISEAADRNGLDASHISKVLRGRRSTHGGYRWKYEEGEVDDSSDEEFLEKRSADYTKDGALLTAKTEKSIQSLDEAIEFFEVDLSVWEVERFIVNSWDVSMKDRDGKSFKRTNYQVKVWLKPREFTFEEVIQDLEPKINEYTPIELNYVRGKGTITVELADFHIGAEIRNLLKTPDFDINILLNYLNEVTSIVNSYNAESVIINLHGDFVESISGLNHSDSWKGIGKEMYGANVLIIANQILAGSLISRINNVTKINIVAGNHDRITPSKHVDGKGEGAKLLAWTLKKDFPNIEINYDSLILVDDIDGINHIITHGHHGISKKDFAKVVADYGDSMMYNLWTEGHLHSRNYTKALKTKLAVYDNVEYVSMDGQNYRKLVLPSLFTGNFFSESIGYTSWAGFVITENNGKGIPNIYDYTL